MEALRGPVLMNAPEPGAYKLGKFHWVSFVDSDVDLVPYLAMHIRRGANLWSS